MASEVEICNRALQRIGAGRISSLADANKPARECSVAYTPARDMLLRMYTWNFAKARASLAADSTAPVHGPTTQFTLPTDFLRLILPNDYDLDWRIEGRKILTDWDAPLEIQYVKKVTDPNIMDELFRETLSARIAYEVCEPITGSNNKKAAQWQDYKDLLAAARMTGALENLAQDPPESSWITVRN